LTTAANATKPNLFEAHSRCICLKALSKGAPEMPGRFAEIVSIEIGRAESRALVVLCDEKLADPFDHFSGLRANFLAHLIATRDRLPQTTVLRRETPEAAVDAYEHTLEASTATKSRVV
jgi:hypothetical protein